VGPWLGWVGHGARGSESGRASGRAKRAPSSETSTTARSAPFLSPVATVNQLQGPHVFRLGCLGWLVWDRKPLAKAVVPTKVGSREYGYGRGHAQGTVICALWVPQKTEAAEVSAEVQKYGPHLAPARVPAVL
jgi:hypothetical protein